MSQHADRSAQVMMTPANTYFSPREQRGRVGPGVRCEDLLPDSNGIIGWRLIQYVLLGQLRFNYLGDILAASASGQYDTIAQHPHTGVYGQPPQSAYQHPPLGADQ